MPYLIDGHNLIPKLPGVSLSDVDDEDRLIEILQEFARHKPGKRIEVYFDRRAPGAERSRTFGNIRAHFIAPPSDADTAIIARLKKLGGSARTWTVVSSDRKVQAAAREAGARVLRAEEFTRQIREAKAPSAEPSPLPSQKTQVNLTPEEVDEWEALFRRREQ